MQLIGLILTVVIAAVVLMVGLVMSNITQQVTDQVAYQDPQLSNITNQILSTSGTAFSMLSLVMFVLAAVFIFVIISGAFTHPTSSPMPSGSQARQPMQQALPQDREVQPFTPNDFQNDDNIDNTVILEEIEVPGNRWEEIEV